jgi:RNA polymerase sigma-70 factor (ECF subfamily)
MAYSENRPQIVTRGSRLARRFGFGGIVYYTEQDTGGPRLDFHIFDAAYVDRLTQGDPDTELHFSSYFGRLLTSKLRVRRIAPQMAEDVRQETFLRVLRTLRQGQGVTQPEAFGAFVSAVCNNVLLESLNKESKQPQIPENAPEPADERVDLDASLITEQRKRVVARILDSLPAKDREVLRMVFIEEADRQEVSRRLGVSAEYLRVLLHRAKSKFEEEFTRTRGEFLRTLVFFAFAAA